MALNKPKYEHTVLHLNIFLYLKYCKQTNFPLLNFIVVKQTHSALFLLKLFTNQSAQSAHKPHFTSKVT